MANIDLAVGGSEAVINNVLKQLFPAVRSLLKQNIGIHQVNIASVDFEVTQPFQVDLQAPTPVHIIEHYREEMKCNTEILKMSPKDQKKLFEASMAMLSQVALMIHLPTVDFTLHYEIPSGGGNPKTQTLQNVKLDIAAVASIQTGGNPATIGVQGVSGTVSTGDPTIDGVLNSAIVPWVVDYLNVKILHSINIPTLSTQGVTIAAPVVAVQNGFLVAYDALGTASPAVPAPNSTWPTDGAFVGVDSSFIMAVANAALSGISLPSGGFGWSAFDGGWNVTNLGPLSGMSIADNGAMTATISLGAQANLTWHTPDHFPNVSFGVGGGGQGTVTISISVINGSATATLNSIDNINISIDGFPSEIPGVGDLTNAILNLIRPAISNALAGKTFKVYDIPTITVPLAGGIDIKLANVATTGVNDDGKTLLVAHGMPQIMSKEMASSTALKN